MASRAFVPLLSWGSGWSWLVCDSQVVLFVLLQDMCHICFISALRSLSQQWWPFSDSRECPHRYQPAPHECISSVPMDSCASSFSKHPLPWHFFIEVSLHCFRLPPWAQESGIAGGWFYQERRSWRVQSTLASSVSFVTEPITSFSSRPTFYLLIPLQMSFLLPFACLA